MLATYGTVYKDVHSTSDESIGSESVAQGIYQSIIHYHYMMLIGVFQ